MRGSLAWLGGLVLAAGGLVAPLETARSPASPGASSRWTTASEVAFASERLMPASGAAAGGAVPDTTSDRIVPTRPSLRQAADAGRAIVDSLRQTLKFPGIAVAVSVDGEIVWSEGLGLADVERRLPVTRRTVFPIYSVSKGLTGTALARLHQSGRIELDAPVRSYLPTFPDKGQPITVRQLAGHLGGIRHYRPGAGEGTALRHCETAEEGLEPFRDDPLVHPPGTDFEYTSYGFVLLSAAMAAAAGKSFEALMTEEVLEPYGMETTYFANRRGWIPDLASRYEYRGDSLGVVPARRMDISCKFGAGAYLSTAEDLVRLADGVLAGRGLTPESRQLLLTPQRDAAGEPIPPSLGWDAGEDVAGRFRLRRTGGNVDGWSALMAYPDGRLAVALLANMRGRDWIHDDAGRIAALFLETSREPRESGR